MCTKLITIDFSRLGFQMGGREWDSIHDSILLISFIPLFAGVSSFLFKVLACLELRDYFMERRTSTTEDGSGLEDGRTGRLSTNATALGHSQLTVLQCTLGHSLLKGLPWDTPY